MLPQLIEVARADLERSAERSAGLEWKDVGNVGAGQRVAKVAVAGVMVGRELL